MKKFSILQKKFKLRQGKFKSPGLTLEKKTFTPVFYTQVY
jgi:hypothetical protein